MILAAGYCRLTNSIVVQHLRRAVHPVGYDVVELAGEVDRAAVGEVASVGQIERHIGVAGVHEREVGGHISLRARVRLNVRMLSANSFFARSMASVSTTSTYSQPP